MAGKQRFTLRGPVVSLNTPFLENGRLDFKGLERLVEHHVREGAVGFLTTARAAELFQLSAVEREEIVRRVRAQTRGRVVCIAGATAETGAQSRSLAEMAVKEGCDAVLAEAPVSLLREHPAVEAFFREFSRIGMPALMIQDWDWDGFGLPVALIRRMFEEIETFASLKVEVRPAGPKYTAVREATAGQLHLAGGWAADQMMEALDRGVDVIMNTSMTRWYRRVFDEYDAGRRERAEAAFRAILPVLAFTRQHLTTSIHFHKREFHRLGVFETALVRLADVPYDAFHEQRGRELMEYLEGIEAQW